jgi:SAM-dependent methyltransferase
MTPIEGCRSCGRGSLVELLALGSMPLANALLDASDLARPERRFPLTLVFCPGCALVQIRETVDPEILFGHYLYFSSFSDTMLTHARDEARHLASRRRLGAGSLVVEIASNDGYLLKNFVELGVPVLGIEPAANIARAAQASGVRTENAFFGRELARRLRADGVRADVVIANNVLAHVADLDGTAAGIAALLKEDGLAAIEFPYVGDMIDAVEFDTIYHEHLCYFSLHAVAAVFARHGLAVTDLLRLPIHGGSLRIYLEREGRPVDGAVTALLREESTRGMDRAPFYEDFAARVTSLTRELVAELRRRKGAGERLAAYGASAKGSTLMNAAGIGSDLLDFVADRSTIKQGRYTPGNRLPIVAPGALVAKRPDAVLLLTWNFADEIFRQQADYLNAGGTFIIPIPAVRSAGKEVLL